MLVCGVILLAIQLVLFQNPYKLKITGRTKHFVNAFGEEVIMDNAQVALNHALEITGAQVREFTVAATFYPQDFTSEGAASMVV